MGTILPVIQAALSAVDGGIDIDIPFSFDMAGLLNVLNMAGVPLDFLGAVMPLQNIITQIKTLDVPVIELPRFDNLVDRIFSNNSIPLKLDI